MTQVEEKGKRGTIGGVVSLVVGSAPGWIGLFYEHGAEILGAFAPVVWIAWPVLIAAIGFFTGWNGRMWYVSRHPQPGDVEKDERIRELEAENEQLGAQCSYLTTQNENLEEALAEANGKIRIIDEEERRRKQDEEAAAREREESEQLAGLLMDFKDDPCGEKKAASAFLFGQPEHRMALNAEGVAYLKSLEINYGFYGTCSCFFDFDDRGDFAYAELVPWVAEVFEAYPSQLEEFTPEMKSKVSEKMESCAAF